MRCNTCHGTGWLRVERPYIEGVAITVVMEPCPDCYAKSACPRCGKPVRPVAGGDGMMHNGCECGWDSERAWREAASRKGAR
jgi:hypothetical protein